MRKTSVVVLTALFALIGVSYAQADEIQSVKAKVTPKKLFKKKFKPAKIWVEVITGDNVGGAVPNEPPKATSTKVDFPKNVRFNLGAVPKCKASLAALQNTSTDQAIGLCGKKSIVSVGSEVPTGPESAPGKSSAWIKVGGPSPIGVPLVVTAFNGKMKNSIYLHARAEAPLPITSVLVGTLKKAPKGYGKRLDVDVPPLSAGGIERFSVAVKAKNYVQARCKTKQMKYRAITAFSNYPDVVSDTYSHKCQRKPVKKKKGGSKGGKRRK